MKNLKVLPTNFFDDEMMGKHSQPCLFLHQQKISMCSHINKVFPCPGNTYNFKTDWSIKYFKWCIAISIVYAINMKQKIFSDIKQLLFSNMNFLSWTSVARSKNEASKIFIVVVMVLLIKINIIAIVFHFIIIESA